MRPIHALCLLLAILGAAPAVAANRCPGFKWDVSRELALFDGPVSAIVAGKTEASAPAVRIDRLYQMQLAPQAEVAFAVAPARSAAAAGTYGGMAVLNLSAPGRYRIAVDAPLWIDAVAGGRFATVRDFQGQQNCDGPRKMVEFDLTGAARFILQFSGSPGAAVRMTVTRPPARKL